MKMKGSSQKEAFTRIDLTAAVAVVLALGILPAPLLSKPEGATRSLKCLSNIQQLTRAWLMYAQDNSGRLPSSGGGTIDTRPVWVTGFLDFSQQPRDWNAPLRQSPLAPYVKHLEVWRCPADRSNVRDLNSKQIPRVRSYSMNDAFGFGNWLPNTIWRTYDELSDVVRPSNTWILMDEHPDSLNDGALAVEMARPNSTTGRIIDFPSSLHHGGASLSHVDGRVEIHRWHSARLRPKVSYSNQLALNVFAGDALKDLKWISQRTTVSRATGTWN